MKAIVSVLGHDRRGIIAGVSRVLFEMDINIEDISQTILQEQYFTMIMMVSLQDSAQNLEQVNERLQALARELNVDIRIQNEDIFVSMHRI